jgi:preprotein translocase subunit SecG
MVIVLTILHVLVCVFLVIVVLLQSGKAADLAGAFGGMGSQTAFGPRGAATVLSKATTIAAGLFMVTSLTLAVMATRNAGVGRSVLDRSKPVTNSKPAAPAGQPVPQGAAPSVTITPEGGGASRTVPLDLDKLPKVDPKNPSLPAPAPTAPKK